MQIEDKEQLKHKLTELAKGNHDLKQDMAALCELNSRQVKKLTAFKREIESLNRQVYATSGVFQPPVSLKNITLRVRLKQLIFFMIIKNSKEFDSAFYRTNLADGWGKIFPLLHYLLIGSATGKNPSSSFDNEAYLRTRPDVKRANLNPLGHYLKYGAKE